MFPLRIIKPNTTIKFMERKWLFFGISILLILGSVFLLMTRGLNYGIDFTGGIVIELRANPPLDIVKLRDMLEKGNFGEVALQNLGNDADLLIRLQAQKGGAEAQQAAVERVKQVVSSLSQSKVEYRKVDYVGPQVGDELKGAAAIGLIASLLGIMSYIWLRFELQYGIGAVISLFHDLILMLGMYSITGLEFNLTSIAAILTVLGYSINDSVVIFDRIRENLRKYKKMPLEGVLNKSINDTLARTMMTASTVITSLVALVWLGGSVLHGFSLAVLLGIVIGTYSSVYIGAPVLIFMRMRREGAVAAAA